MTDGKGNEPGRLDFLLTRFAEHVPEVEHVLAVSVDGLAIAASEGLPRDRADQLAAIASGLASLTDGAARCLTSGLVRQTVVDMDGGVLLLLHVADKALLTVVAGSGCDLGHVGYEATMLAKRVGAMLDPDTRNPG